METAEAEFTIINALGLHARAAAQLVKAANKYPCDVELECEGQPVNGKSIMGVLMLAAAQGMKVKVKCTGEQARACLDEVAALIANKFGEPQVTPLYFDHNATTPLLAEVVEAMEPYLTTHFGNPSSAHAYGREAKAAIERARASVAALVGASPDELIFTSGGTEATQLALRGTLPMPLDPAHVITTTVEHPATARTVDALQKEGLKVTRLGVDAGGLVSVDALTAALHANTRWFSVIHAHNETGVLQPLAELSAVTKRHHVLLHVDAAQSAGKVPLSMARDGFDLLTLAAHKLYGPKGVGALVVRKGVTLRALQLGAGQEHGLRAGTENVASIVGFGVACEAARRDLQESAARLTSLREQLITALRAGVPELIIAGEQSARLPNTVYALFPGVSGAALLAKAPGVAASTGSACHDGQETPPQVLLEMKVPAERALGAVRLSLGRHSMPEHVEAVAAELIAALAGFR